MAAKRQQQGYVADPTSKSMTWGWGYDQQPYVRQVEPSVEAGVVV